MPFVVGCIVKESCSVPVKNWFGCTPSVDVNLTEFYNEFSNGVFDNDPVDEDLRYSFAEVKVGPNKNSSDLTKVAPSSPLRDVVNNLGSFIMYVLAGEPKNVPSTRPNRNAFTVLMAASSDQRLATALPKHFSQEHYPRKSLLKNTLIDWLKSINLGWTPDLVNSTGLQFVNTLGNVLWYIDRNHSTLAARGCPVPAEFVRFSGFRCPEKQKKRKIDESCLHQEELKAHASSLYNLSMATYMQKSNWASVCEAILSLANTLTKYANYLASQNKRVKENHGRMTINTSIEDHFKVLQSDARMKPSLLERYRSLHKILLEAKNEEPVFINDFAPEDRRRRFEYISELTSPCKAIYFSHTSGGTNLHFLWKVADLKDESELLTDAHKIVKQMNFPSYHSRTMKREFIHLFGKATGCKAAFLRHAYQRLTGDMSAPTSSKEAAVDNRVAEMLELQDPELVVDLRVNNDGRPEKFTAFLEECKKFINNSVETAVDDRRHDVLDKDGQVIVHLATALSVRDLHDQVQKRCAEGTPIPSVQWLRLQFWPRRINAASSKRYYGRLNIRYMIQARQFRQQHLDMHYASAIFRYLKEFAVKFREETTFICMDDKHSMKVGEPGYPVAAVERGKSVLVAKGTTFQVGDHDFTRLSLIPSVILKIDIPETVEESWYQGEVFVGIKDHTFEPSSARRHAAELHSVLSTDSNPILALYTDGGPDHRVNLLSVQISLICLFLKEDRDMVVAARTPPYNSWKDPAERVMSTLNCGAQCIGLMRKATEIEPMVTNCNSLKSLRKLADDNPDIDVKKEILNSVQPCKDLLGNIFQRLTFSGTPISMYDATTDQQIEELWSHIHRIDKTLELSDTTKMKIKKKEDFKKFFDSHCRDRHYLFSVKKCSDPECQFHRLPNLPPDQFEELFHLPDPVPNGDKYEDFSNLYGHDQPGPEKHRPSLKKTQAVVSGHGMPFNPKKQTASNANRVIQCEECGKWRVIHSAKKLTRKEAQELDILLETIDYSCGADLSDLNEELTLTVFIRRDLTCLMKIEVTYYCPGNDSICLFCGSEEQLVEVDDDCYPLCSVCKDSGQIAQKKQTRTFTPRM